MHRSGRSRVGAGGLARLVVIAIAVLAMTPSLVNQAQAADTATITVKSFLKDGATPLPFVRFQVTDSNGTVYGPLESAPPDGKVSFTVDPVDAGTTFEITEETPPACAIAPDPIDVGPLNASDVKNIEISTSFLDAADCDLGAISLYSWDCPGGTDAGGTDYSAFQQACTTTVDGKSYHIADTKGSQSWDVVTGAYGISGRAPLVGLEPSTYSITDSQPEAGTTTVVFCATYDVIPTSAASTPNSVAQTKVSKHKTSLAVDSDRIACDFFAVPTSSANGNAEPTETPVDNGGGVSQSGSDSGTAWLEVHLAACPAGYDGSDFFDNCHGNGLADHTISLKGPNGYSDAAQTVMPNDPGPGVARFEHLDAGKYKVTEDIPGDTDTYFAYCSMADSDQQVAFTYDDSTSESIRLSIADGEQIVCDLYIVPNKPSEPTETPVAGTGKLTVTKYTCPTGESVDDYSDLSNDCTNATDGVTFTLNPTGDGATQTAVSGSDGTTGRVRFTALDPGTYVLSEDVPGEVSTPVVWCNLAGGDWYQKDVSARGGASFDVEAGDDIRCSWFNRPEDLSGGGSLRIHKSLCPAGLTSGYYDTCYDNTLSGVGFTADGPSGYEQAMTTGDSGVVTFDNLNAGTYTVAETPPDNVVVAVYVVVCTRNGNSYDFSYDDSNGLKINVKIPAGTEIDCDWYNVPPAKQPAGTGSITVIASLCQGNKDNKYDWQKECDPFGAGLDFSLTSVSKGTTTSGATGSNSKLVFSGLADGTYALQETNGDWCHAEADLVDASGNVKVANGGNTNVYIYNCNKAVSTLPATGVGPVSGGGAGGMMLIWGVAGLAGIVLLARARRPRPVYATIRRARH
jgi:hypothetical protein